MVKSLEKWCIDNNRMDILEEYGGILGEYKKFTKASKMAYNSSEYVKWNCLKCGSYKALKVKERILQDKIECLKCKNQKALSKRFEKLQSEIADISYLARVIHSSIPEQYLYYYLKKAFNNIESQKQFNWLRGMSIDIYIPEYRLGIEYDGERYHSNNNNDKLKYEICQNNQVRLLRIVEVSKQQQTKTKYPADWYYLYSPNYNYTNISEVIFALLNYIDKNKESIFLENPINLRNDFVHIEKQIKKEFDKRTLFYKWSELVKYWDFKRNGDILPNHVFKSDKKTYYLKCPKCNSEYSFNPSKRRKAIPPCTCEKSQYIKRAKEIVSIYENLGLIKFEDTLLDRQIEDEILRTADGLYQCYKYFGTIDVYHMESSRFSKPFIACYLNNYTNKKIY
ncbi:zinc-ribbon domain-containing protein [Bacillus sp. es.036]|uniref:zinc-ribbon domain-containing protein n=1 Tax=Bacillus sp. es.036 TaxID=1761764 RepID=UPI000BF52734|nr:zinc-ribbon domain-containing protein [Bacillus sp. es.036]PFG03039.1 putative zinc ribbon protein [Bacillus sp. es.036]